jgi:hypothetical protein
MTVVAALYIGLFDEKLLWLPCGQHFLYEKTMWLLCKQHFLFGYDEKTVIMTLTIFL